MTKSDDRKMTLDERREESLDDRKELIRNPHLLRVNKIFEVILFDYNCWLIDKLTNERELIFRKEDKEEISFITKKMITLIELMKNELNYFLEDLRILSDRVMKEDDKTLEQRVSEIATEESKDESNKRINEHGIPYIRNAYVLWYFKDDCRVVFLLSDDGADKEKMRKVFRHHTSSRDYSDFGILTGVDFKEFYYGDLLNYFKFKYPREEQIDSIVLYDFPANFFSIGQKIKLRKEVDGSWTFLYDEKGA